MVQYSSYPSRKHASTKSTNLQGLKLCMWEGITYDWHALFSLLPGRNIGYSPDHRSQAWGLVSAAVEQSRCKASMVAWGDGKFGPIGWPRIPSNQKGKIYLIVRIVFFFFFMIKYNTCIFNDLDSEFSRLARNRTELRRNGTKSFVISEDYLRQLLNTSGEIYRFLQNWRSSPLLWNVLNLDCK